MFTMGALFRRTAQDVARHLKFEYPLEEDRRVTDYLKRVQNLPRNATAFI
ncbi:aminoglycoside 6-adenylyltransferase [Lactiplantibacillus plantarum]